MTEKKKMTGTCPLSSLIIVIIMLMSCGMVQAQERVAYSARTSVKKLTKKAEKGDAVAQFQLGHDYYWGLIGEKRDFVEARKWLSMAAYHGNPEAQMYLGRIFRYGRDVEKNMAQAYSLFQQALQGGCTGVYSDLGEMIVFDNYPEHIPQKKGIEYLIRAADNRDGYAYGLLASCYLYGFKGLVDRDVKKAEKYALKGAAKDDVNSNTVLGMVYGRTGDHISAENLKKAHPYFMKAAEGGNYISQYEVGRDFLHGYGVEKDSIEAVKWLKKGAEDNVNAQSLLGRLYYRNPDSLGRAAHYFELAYNQGDADATNYLGMMYGNGSYYNKNEREALKYYIKADSLGSAHAPSNIADYMVYGLGGMKVDLKKALEYYGSSYVRGYKAAKDYASRIFAKGNKTAIDCYNRAVKEKDRKKQFALFEKSAKNGNAYAQAVTGYHYLDGGLVKKDTKKAFKYLKQAVDNGCVEGLLNLGYCYCYGYGVKQDLEEAANLFKLAANLGDETAKKYLAAVERQDHSGISSMAKIEEKKVVNQQMRKVALLIGNARYQKLVRLNNSVNDATDLDIKLRMLGFDTEMLSDCDKMDFDKALTRFKERASTADVAFFYYSGHGIQRNNENYLLPVDINIEKDADKMYLGDVSTSLSDVLEKVGQSGCKMKVFVIDACRENPFDDKKVYKGAKKQGGLGEVKSPPEGTLIVYSTAPGELALDGLPGDRNSPYTKALLEYIDKPGMEIEEMFKAVGSKIKSMTGQTPYRVSITTENFYLNPIE